MEITHQRKRRLHGAAAQFLSGIAGLAVITFVCFQLGFGEGRTAFAYLILIALASLLGSFSVSVVLSIVAVALLNYFFVSPLFDHVGKGHVFCCEVLSLYALSLDV